MQIIARLQIAGERIERIIEGPPAELAEIAHGRPIRHAADTQPCALSISNRSAGNEGEVAVPSAELTECRARAPWQARKPHSLDQLIVLTCG